MLFLEVSSLSHGTLTSANKSLAFLVGLICPHDGGFAIKVTEKIEDLVSVLFLPLYFALSGLSTNLGLLNDGITWGYVFGVIAVAFAGKIIGGTLAARANKLVWRESLTIGCLMSCKGLVELIVLVSQLYTHSMSCTDRIEHRPSSQDPVNENLHNIRRHGISHHRHNDPSCYWAIPTLVSEETRIVEARRD